VAGDLAEHQRRQHRFLVGRRSELELRRDRTFLQCRSLGDLYAAERVVHPEVPRQKVAVLPVVEDVLASERAVTVVRADLGFSGRLGRSRNR